MNKNIVPVSKWFKAKNSYLLVLGRLSSRERLWSRLLEQMDQEGL